jgi:hypothetical protein
MKIEKESKGRPYRITSTIITDERTGKKKLITFYRNKKNPKEYGNEIYSGSNYIVGEEGVTSHSRVYPHGKGLPKKYKVITKKLKELS